MVIYRCFLFNKTGLGQLNDSVYYTSDGVCSLPHGHPYLENIIKQRDGKTVPELFEEKFENETLYMEEELILKVKRLRYHRALINHTLPSGHTVHEHLVM